jgi:hypothetical protein
VREKSWEETMSGFTNKRPPKRQERSQSPLWFAIAGLVISVASYGMQDLMIGDVVFWFGLVFAGIGMLYYFLQPKHGLPPGKS